MSERQTMEVDVVCVGFGPATAGFLTTLSRATGLESAACPGMPLQVLCYERADDVGFGVSGVVTRARGIRASFPELNPAEIPMATPVTGEKVVFLLDPIGASVRSSGMRAAERVLNAANLPRQSAVELPYTPPFLEKHDGIVMSVGQFLQYVAGHLMAQGAVQIWPGMPVREPLIEDNAVRGIRLADMDIRAALTVVGDGPVGCVGRQIDQHFGMPPSHCSREWAVGMKMVVGLGVDLAPGTVIHTFGFPEPEIFGFLYAHPDRIATAGIFVPSWLRSPARTSYRYLQHFIQHPYLWQYMQGAKLRSWGAKSLQESGRRGEPYLAGNGYARIGEGSGSTNVLTGSGVDEAWTTGTQLAEGVIELLRSGKPMTRENLEQMYVARRRASWLEEESRTAECARDGFHSGLLSGLFGMALAGFTKGKVAFSGEPKRALSFEDYYQDKLSHDEVRRIVLDCRTKGLSTHDALMDRVGWPRIEHDGQLLMTQQDALLLGGKVQAAPGDDHVHIVDQQVCRKCDNKLCVEICSGQALGAAVDGVPTFDREKCVHCGACQWNCELGNLIFEAGSGGLHSSEN